MSIESIKLLAAGLIAPLRTELAKYLLDQAASSALAMYSALKPLSTSIDVNATIGTADTDERGAFIPFELLLTTGILYATMITVAGEQYPHRITGTDATKAYIRIYGFTTTDTACNLTVWRPAAHNPTIPTWPPHHEALIALMTASYYLNALALQQSDATLADAIQNVASSYYGRATTTLSQIE